MAIGLPQAVGRWRLDVFCAYIDSVGSRSRAVCGGIADVAGTILT